MREHVGPAAAYFRAGFRRYSAYRVATAAGAFANTVFGILHASILIAAIDGAPVTAATGSAVVAGYSAAQASTYAWLVQALLAPLALFGWNELGQRVRTGDIAIDLARPVDLQLSWLAADLGRAAFQLIPRALPPLAVGAIWFGLALPATPLPYLLGAVSMVLAASTSFACRFAMNLTAFWLLDIRGVVTLYTVLSNLLCGLFFPLGWCPPWLRTLAYATPFPSMLQTPVDVVSGRASGLAALHGLAVQGLWLAGSVVLGRAVLRRATAKLVVQGG